ncbi:MAG: Fe-S protein assembly co-chaperone HscB [Luminiphilus sp.]|jgi:molecular chaperone HscB|nr:Fe-S protein assembly co-chaperone HscB [Luminiphilus sp.]MDG1461116.1 Fe-S protein assembly co-chaperone HscB [Luminiphilus sp.]
MSVVADGFSGAPKNYFDLFQIEPRFNVDVDDLGQRFRTLQRRFHPDKFVGGSAAEQRLAAQVSADINAGYQALKDPITRAGHMLELQACDLRALERQPVSGEFLMQQMQLRDKAESLDPDDDEGLKTLTAEAQALMASELFSFEEAIEKEDYELAGSAWVHLLYLHKLNKEVAGRSDLN